MRLLLSLLLAGLAPAQTLPPVSAASDYAHLNPAITPPLLVHSTDPQYTPQALAAQIQGAVVLQAVIGLNGSVTHASILSPLPAGLGEKALEAVAHWHYKPGTMDAEQIPVLTTIDVVFRLPYQRKRLPPPPMPTDLPAAAFMGQPAADLQLASKAEQKKDFKQAEHYLRLCAAEANPTCEYQLGRLLVEGPNINPNDFAQGVAWLELATGHKNQPATALHATAAAKLSSLQEQWVAALKPHLEQKHY